MTSPTIVAVKAHPAVDVATLAASLEAQAAQLDSAWNTGRVRVLTYSKRKPIGAWRIEFYDSLPPGMGGVHMGSAKHPYAKVLASEGSVAASHEFCEMLVDPAGTRFVEAGDRRYLVEVCDPCEAQSYVLRNSLVSDFVLPAYYDEVASGSVDFLGSLLGPAPRLAPGGYLSWITRGEWWQVFADMNGVLSTRRLGTAKLGTRREKDALVAGYTTAVVAGYLPKPRVVQ